MDHINQMKIYIIAMKETKHSTTVFIYNEIYCDYCIKWSKVDLMQDSAENGRKSYWKKRSYIHIIHVFGQMVLLFVQLWNAT